MLHASLEKQYMKSFYFSSCRWISERIILTQRRATSVFVLLFKLKYFHKRNVDEVNIDIT